MRSSACETVGDGSGEPGADPPTILPPSCAPFGAGRRGVGEEANAPAGHEGSIPAVARLTDVGNVIEAVKGCRIGGLTRVIQMTRPTTRFKAQYDTGNDTG